MDNNELLPVSQHFCNVTHSWHSAVNSVIVAHYVTMNQPMNGHTAPGKMPDI